MFIETEGTATKHVVLIIRAENHGDQVETHGGLTRHQLMLYDVMA